MVIGNTGSSGPSPFTSSKYRTQSITICSMSFPTGKNQLVNVFRFFVRT
jgi:hypothetical protein